MQTRILGRTGLAVSVIGFGGIPIRRPAHDEAVALYRRAMDLGMTYFDAARAYVRNEERLGEAIEGRRDEVVLASRDLSHTKEEMAAAIETSLQTLGTDYVDIYQCHELHQMTDLDECLAPGGAFEALDEARDAGKIRFIGMTSHNPDVIMAGLETGLMDSILIMLNYVNRRMVEDVLPRAKADNVGVAVMKPLGGCLLASHADLALRWVLSQEGVHTTIPGMWRPFEVEANAMVGESFEPLTEAEHRVLDEMRATKLPQCCRLCYRHHTCPKGVEISRLMIMDVLYQRHGIEEALERGWDRDLAAIEQCFTCETREECRASCGFGVDIPAVLERIYHTFYPPLAQARSAE
ncbi:MAG: aldo/keto reductase [candidate division WS1 bacterium]|nr:aldo/keto reductase [candidate division WS1 bacterium]